MVSLQESANTYNNTKSISLSRSALFSCNCLHWRAHSSASASQKAKVSATVRTYRSIVRGRCCARVYLMLVWSKSPVEQNQNMLLIMRNTHISFWRWMKMMIDKAQRNNSNNEPRKKWFRTDYGYDADENNDDDHDDDEWWRADIWYSSNFKESISLSRINRNAQTMKTNTRLSANLHSVQFKNWPLYFTSINLKVSTYNFYFIFFCVVQVGFFFALIKIKTQNIS